MGIPQRNLASCLLAKAVKTLFPDVRLLGGQGTATGFYYDFLFPFSFHNSMISMIEEKMRQDRSSPKLMEMAAPSASALLGHCRNADRIAHIAQPVVSIVQAGDFADLCEGPIAEAPVHFKILQALEIEGKIRLFGQAQQTKDELKQAVRSWEPIEENPHHDIFLETEGAWTWLPKGVYLRQAIYGRLQQELQNQNFQWITTHARTLKEIDRRHALVPFSKTAEISVFDQKKGEGLYQSATVFMDQFYLRGTASEETIISSLHFILKFLKIFSFDLEVVSSLKTVVSGFPEARLEKAIGTQVEIRIKDRFGRFWPGPHVGIDRPRKTVFGSVLGPMERFVALLLEKGKMPFWLVPEQVRIFDLSSCRGHLVETLRQAGFRAELDRKSGSLKKRVSDALRESVPFSIVIGDRESAAETVSVRALGEENPVVMTVEKLITRLKEFENQ